MFLRTFHKIESYMNSIQNIRGTVDILPDTSYIWEWFENKARGLFSSFGYREIRTPVFEQTELFSRSIGEGTDIVSKEMYSFEDKKGRGLTLRPEGTACVVRSALQHKLISQGILQKLFYIGPMFRYERPQEGRQRQFHQTGVEILGSASPLADIEAIVLLKSLLDTLGLKQVKFRINSAGSRHLRSEMTNRLRDVLKPYLSSLCPDCHMRFEKNVLRVYDCKVAGCKEVTAKLPGLYEMLAEEDRQHFEEVKKGLTRCGIEYELDDRLVRGLDYYTRTLFEAYSTALGACDAIAGGGRYDNLFSEMGSLESVPAVGFAVGMERIINLLTQLGQLPQKPALQLFLVHFSEVNALENMKLISELRNAGFSVEMELMQKSIKAQFKSAERCGAKIAIVRGEDEIVNKKVKVKKLADRTEWEVPEAELIEHLKTLFKEASNV